MTHKKKNNQKKEDVWPEPPDESITAESRESYDLFIAPNPREREEAADTDVEGDLATEELYQTQRSEGHTYNPIKAWRQGLTYTPPSDPPVTPSQPEERQGAEFAAGFAPSMEASDPDVEDLPERVDNNDLDLQDDVYQTLQTNSETRHLTGVKVQVNQGVVNLLGTVESEDDIGRVIDLVWELDGVADVSNNLQVGE